MGQSALGRTDLVGLCRPIGHKTKWMRKKECIRALSLDVWSLFFDLALDVDSSLTRFAPQSCTKAYVQGMIMVVPTFQKKKLRLRE